VQHELARRSQLRAVGLPDLLVAAVAERHRVTVLHHDADFDLIAGVTGQRVEWVGR
jgi:predicted nucleic acid-binding protein